MHCPYCNASDTKVIDSRLAAEGAHVRIVDGLVIAVKSVLRPLRW